MAKTQIRAVSELRVGDTVSRVCNGKPTGLFSVVSLHPQGPTGSAAGRGPWALLRSTNGQRYDTPSDADFASGRIALSLR